MTRTPLLRALRESLHLARDAERRGVPTAEVLERREGALSRRAVLRSGAVGAAALALGACAAPRVPEAATLNALGGGAGQEPVAIVGAGVAGLVVAYRLTRAGIPCRVYESSGRVGGRMKTLRGRFGRPVELGGEFIDSGHKQLRRLARELGLDTVDLAQRDVGLAPQLYDIGGRTYMQADAADAFRTVVKRIDADVASLGAETVSYRLPDLGRRLDQTPLSAYFAGLGAPAWLVTLLNVAYTIEYGLDTAEQSTLNFLYLVGTEPGQFKVFGYSDERYAIVGGNDQVPARLVGRIGNRVEYGARLEAVAPRADGRFTLTLEEGGARREVTAPRVVFALPFTMLRGVDLSRLALPAVKRRAIAELGYGTNAKLIAPFRTPLWRGQYGSSGEVFTDQFWQNTWESSRGVDAPGGCLTNFLGGRAGLAVGAGTAEAQTARWVAEMDRVFPGLRGARTAEAPVRADWPNDPFVRASYACYRPGQWTSISGAEAEAVGALHFCGEHTSIDAQGYMEGGVESGERASREVLGALIGRNAVSALA